MRPPLHPDAALHALRHTSGPVDLAMARSLLELLCLVLGLDPSGLLALRLR